jgi:BirA family biotin operon repressor/biotin-[acetyl-CoA-carboxylase] ligase
MIASSAGQAPAARRVGRAVERHDVISSTNDRARELLALGGADGMVVVAETQTAGRGRNGRTWISPAGSGLFLSAALEPRVGVDDAGMMALGTALAVQAACDPVAAVGLKWPNDVVAPDGRKVAGILIETMLSGDRVVGAVIGIGVNVDWPPDEVPDDLRGAATSLAELAGAPVDRSALLERLLDALSAEITAIEEGRSPLPRYRLRCSTLGQRVEVAVGDRTVIGIARDIDASGALVVESDGTRHPLTGGEVISVRPVAG